MDPAEQSAYIGETLDGRYEVEALIGSGHFSGVFRATDTQSGDAVAIKILSFRNAPEARIEFDGERELLEALTSCSNVLTLRDSGQHQLALQTTAGVALPVLVEFLVFELADANLTELLVRRHELPWEERLALFRDVAKGVHQMHIRQMVHRDTKSDNALLFSAPDITAKLADLGRSRDTTKPPRFSAEAYVAGRGDLRFAPPELLWLCGTTDPVAMALSDLYLLGSILFELGTGIGLTSAALGNPRLIVDQAVQLPESARAADYTHRHHELRERYEPAFAAFSNELSAALRGPALQLLRQLTDPNPAKRVPSFRRRNPQGDWNLEWLLRRVDVLRKVESLASRQSRPRNRRKARQP